MVWPDIACQEEWGSMKLSSGTWYACDVEREVSKKTKKQKQKNETSLAVQWLGLHTSKAGGREQMPCDRVKNPNQTNKTPEREVVVRVQGDLLGWKKRIAL